MNVFAVLYGVPTWGFAALWAVLAGSLTVRTIRMHLPFALTWWRFTFPVGTFVTGTTALAVHTSLPAFRWAAVIAYAGLLLAWTLVAVRTARGSIRGDLFLPPEPALATGTKGRARHPTARVAAEANDRSVRPKTSTRSRPDRIGSSDDQIGLTGAGVNAPAADVAPTPAARQAPSPAHALAQSTTRDDLSRRRPIRV